MMEWLQWKVIELLVKRGVIAVVPVRAEKRYR